MHAVLDVFSPIAQQCFVEPCVNTPLEIANDNCFKNYFSNCIGAMDGTHITAIVENNPELQKRWRNRKAYFSQNVLAVCNFDMPFSYVLAGWEGSAHDSQVLRDA